MTAVEWLSAVGAGAIIGTALLAVWVAWLAHTHRRAGATS